MDSTTEIDLDELLKDVVMPSGSDTSQSPPAPGGFDFDINQANPFPDIKTGGLSRDTMFSMAPEARGEKKRDPSEPDLTLTHFEKVEKFFDFALFRLEGVHVLEDAKMFVGADIFVERENASSLLEGEFYAFDLCSCLVFFEGVALGKKGADDGSCRRR